MTQMTSLAPSRLLALAMLLPPTEISLLTYLLPLFLPLHFDKQSPQARGLSYLIGIIQIVHCPGFLFHGSHALEDLDVALHWRFGRMRP